MDFKKSCLSSGASSTHTRSKKGDGLKRPGLKTGVENNIFFWSEITGRTGRHTPTKNSREYLPRLPTKNLRETLYLILTENLFQFCGSNYLQTHGTTIGTNIESCFC